MYLLPEVVRHIDELIKVDLEALRDSYFAWLLMSSFAVALGVALEGPEIVHEFIGAVCRPSRPKRTTPSWITWLALVGWLFVVLGIAGEGVGEALVSRADGLVKTFNDILLTDTQRESASAEERAANAEAELQSAKTDSAIARKNAEGFRLQIAQANERAAKAEKTTEDERLARVEIQKQIAWRTVTEKQADKMKDLSAPLKDEHVILQWYSVDPEVNNFAALLGSALSTAGLKVTPYTGVIGGGMFSVAPLSVCIGRKRAKSAAALATMLVVAELAPAPIPQCPVPNDPEELRIKIGPKAKPVFDQPSTKVGRNSSN